MKSQTKNLAVITLIVSVIMLSALAFVAWVTRVTASVPTVKSDVSRVKTIPLGMTSEEYRAFIIGNLRDAAAGEIEDYELAKRSGNVKDAYYHAGNIAGGFKEQRDDDNYRKWKQIEEAEAKRVEALDQAERKAREAQARE